jgi:hypothetical protein
MVAEQNNATGSVTQQGTWEHIVPRSSAPETNEKLNYSSFIPLINPFHF